MFDTTDDDIVHPDYIRIIKRKQEGWLFKAMKPFYTFVPNIDIQDTETLYGISKQQIVIELFRINGGKFGFYVADLRHKRYYYCGLESESLKPKLLEIGIGRRDPN